MYSVLINKHIIHTYILYNNHLFIIRFFIGDISSCIRENLVDTSE